MYKKILKYIGVLLLIVFISSIINLELEKSGLYNSQAHPILAGLGDDEFFNILVVFFGTVVFHPIIEEFAFRYFLKPSKDKIIIGVSFLSTFTFIFFTELHSNAYLISSRVDFYIIFIALASLLLLGLKKTCHHLRLKNNILIIFNSKYAVIISSLLFALFHLNVVGEAKHPSLYCIVLAPYFAKALVYAHVRKHMGFKYGLLCHSTYNLILICGVVLLKL